MHLMQLLHNTFEKKLKFIHAARLKNIMSATEACIQSNQLTLTALGRYLPRNIKIRSNIKKMDRLLGNTNLQEESKSFYKTMCSLLIKENACPWIHIDWSCICSRTQLYLLRASISMPGRSQVLYEEIHPKKNENNHHTHQLFLMNLKAVLPNKVRPIIITDAGFRAPWFECVRELDWDFVGRIRNKNLILLDNKSKWELSEVFYKEASAKPNNLGQARLTRRRQIRVNVVLYKGNSRNRHKLNKDNSRSISGKSKLYSRSQKEAWLLVTSLKGTMELGKTTVNIYRQRMRIEENFRDLKCSRYGFGLKESRTRSTSRMKILLLIGAIASFACWLAGLLTKQAGNAADYQAHSSKFTSVLSMVYLGREVLKKTFNITQKKFSDALLLLFDATCKTQLETIFHE